MKKFKEFLNKAAADNAAKEEILGILEGKMLSKATDEQLAKVSEVAQKLGVDITAEEIKEFASGGAELGDDELESVAGGFDSEGRPDSIEDWYLLACEVNEYGRETRNYTIASERVAKKYNLDPIEVLDNWFWFVINAKDTLT